MKRISSKWKGFLHKMKRISSLKWKGFTFLKSRWNEMKRKLFLPTREKIQKSELFHFSHEIYVIKFCPVGICSSSKSEKCDDVNLPRKMTKLIFLCFFTNKSFFLHKSKVDGLKKLIYYLALFFWFDTFEGMSFFNG